MKMISHKNRRGRLPKMSKNIERLYKEGKCRDFSVVVTRMDFAKILGKFTKVKIQYESSSSSKTKKNIETSPNANSRLKSNENGMVLVHRNAYNEHPVKEIINSRKGRSSIKTPIIASPRQSNNVLKENNRLRKTTSVKDLKLQNSNYSQPTNNLKNYGIIFINPNVNNNNDLKNKTSLVELLPDINKSILPSEEWGIDYFPKNEEPKEDKVYDRIAAELEDLMYNEKVSNQDMKTEPIENDKVDDFPSIMDILNENTAESNPKTNDQSSDLKSQLESSDVEAMLLGKSNDINKEPAPTPTPMNIDSTDISQLITAEEPLDAIQNSAKREEGKILSEETMDKNCLNNPNSPSILGETLQKGIEEQLPVINPVQKECPNEIVKTEIKPNTNDSVITESQPNLVPKIDTVTHVVFKQTVDGKCYRCVTCPKNLKYTIEFNGKPVEFIGAPKFISSLEDLQVLLQIVNETHLTSLYVLH